MFAEPVCVLFDIYCIRRAGAITSCFLLGLPRPAVPGSAPGAGQSSGINDHPAKGTADGSGVDASAVASPSFMGPRDLEMEAAGL